MVSFMNVFGKMFALLSAFLLLLTGSLNAPFNGEIYEYQSSHGVVGLHSLTRAQGVTTDGESFIYSGKASLERVSLDNSTVLAVNTCAITKELSEKYGSEHIGGISYYDDIIYAPLEDSKTWKHPVIALYNAKTLEYTGVCFELPADIQTRGVPWVIADGENGVAYTGDSRNYNEIFKWDLTTFEYLGSLTFSQPVEKIQGGEIYNGIFYFGTNDKTRAVYAVNAQNGEAEKLFDRIMYNYKYIDNFGGEGEDLTVLELEDGTFIHTLQIGVTFTDATLRHYKLPTFTE